MDQISTRYFFQSYVTPIVYCATILDKLKQKYQGIVVYQWDNAAANTKEAKERAHKVKLIATESTQHQE